MFRVIVFGLSCFLLLIACGRKEQVPNHTVIITGQFQNADNPVVTVYNYGEEVGTDSLDTNGRFCISYVPFAPGYYTMRMGKSSLEIFLAPGDSLHIESDAMHFDSSLAISGSKVAENKYLQIKLKIIDESGLDDYWELMKLEPEAYLKTKDSLFALLQPHFERTAKIREIDPQFKEMERLYFEYQSLYMDHRYPIYYGHINKVPIDSIQFPKEEISERIKQLPIDRPDLLPLKAYFNLLEVRINTLLSDWRKDTARVQPYPYDFYAQKYKAIDALIDHHEVREFLHFKMLQSAIKYRGPYNIKELLSSFAANISDSRYLKYIDESVLLWDPVLPGREVPDFTFTDLDGNTRQLGELRGKLVYIDVWATWCGPCIAEHPHWDKLVQAYEGKPVAFLAVSLDNTRAPWEKMVAQKALTGMHWYAAGDWNSAIARHFLIKGIPRFLLIDAEGKVLDPTAERPSGKIREVIDGALERMTQAGTVGSRR